MLPGPFHRITPLNAKLRAELPCMLLVLNATVSGLATRLCVVRSGRAARGRVI